MSHFVVLMIFDTVTCDVVNTADTYGILFRMVGFFVIDIKYAQSFRKFETAKVLCWPSVRESTIVFILDVFSSF